MISTYSVTLYKRKNRRGRECERSSRGVHRTRNSREVRSKESCVFEPDWGDISTMVATPSSHLCRHFPTHSHQRRYCRLKPSNPHRGRGRNIQIKGPRQLCFRYRRDIPTVSWQPRCVNLRNSWLQLLPLTGCEIVMIVGYTKNRGIRLLRQQIL